MPNDTATWTQLCTQKRRESKWNNFYMLVEGDLDMDELDGRWMAEIPGRYEVGKTGKVLIQKEGQQALLDVEVIAVMDCECSEWYGTKHYSLALVQPWEGVKKNLVKRR